MDKLAVLDDGSIIAFDVRDWGTVDGLSERPRAVEVEGARCPRCGSILITNGSCAWCTFVGGSWSASANTVDQGRNVVYKRDDQCTPTTS